MNPHHQQVIDLFTKYFNDKEFIGIDIGTAEGFLPFHLLKFIPNLKMVYTIDPYLHIPGNLYEAALEQNWHDDRKARAAAFLSEFPNRHMQLCMTSNDAVAATPNEVDFVWIDGDHMVEQATRDLENYYPKVRSGGIFGGHDCQVIVPIVESGAFPLKEKLILGDDLTWWVFKE